MVLKKKVNMLGESIKGRGICRINAISFKGMFKYVKIIKNILSKNKYKAKL